MGRRILSGAVLIVLAVAAMTMGAGSSPSPSAPVIGSAVAQTRSPSPAPARVALPDRANVVLVLTDDLTTDLVQYMPNVRQMEADGVSFSNYVVADSLCCPSRATLLTGRFAHNTGVYTNAGPDGGLSVFRAMDQETDTFATALESSGYATALMGKYLNGYRPDEYVRERVPAVPPGWTEWAATGNGYPGYDYRLNENGNLTKYGKKPQDYIVDVLSRKAKGFVTRSAAAGTPFVLEIATFTPHLPAVAAPRDAGLAKDVTAPRGPAYDRLPADPPVWLRNHPALSAAEQRHIDDVYRRRVRSVAAIDRMIGELRATLRAAGVEDDTYVVFTSDNGFHMGEHRLMPGKQTAYDHDVRVPLVMVGPGVAPGVRRPEIVQNVDLAPTFVEMAGLPDNGRMDGRSLRPLLSRTDRAPDPGWRKVALIEHHHPTPQPGDPDRQGPRAAFPPTYTALRAAEYLYVEYASGDVEYYDLRTDPDELVNLGNVLTPVRRDELRGMAAALSTCVGTSACSAAAARSG